MNMNTSHRGRTVTGRYTYRPLLEPTEDDFHPNSVYWERQANGAVSELLETQADGSIDVWFDETFPEGSTCTWKDIALKARELLHELIIAKEEEKS